MRRRLVITGSLALLLAAAGLAAFLYYIGFTEQGLQFVVRQIPRRIGPAELRIEAPRGTLAHGFEVARVEVEHERCHLLFQGIKGRLTLIPLLWETIDAHDVTLRYVSVEVRRRTHDTPPSVPRFLPAGLAIHADHTQVQAGTVIAPNGQRLEFSHIDTSGVARARTLRFFASSFDWDAMHVNGSAEIGAAKSLRVAGDARITLTWPNQPVWVIDAMADGDLAALGIQARFTAPFRADFNGRALDLTGNWHWQGDARVHDFDLRAFGAGGALGRITGALAVHGDAAGFAARGSLDPQGLKAGTFQADFSGSYADHVLTARQMQLRHPSGAVVQGAGTIAVVNNGPRLDLRGEWHDFRWPLLGKAPAVRSARGEYALSGVWPYDWRAKGPLAITGLAPIPFEGKGRLAKDRVSIDDSTIQALDGHAQVQGEAVWSPVERWDARGQARGIDPSVLRADLPGKLNFAFEAQGAGFDGTGDYSVALHDLSGTLRKVSASGAGRLARHGEAWQLDGIRLALGTTRISADGLLARESNLSFSLDTADLSLLTPGSRGQLHAQGQWSGTLLDPTLRATLHGSGIHHAGVSLEHIDASIDFDARGGGPAKIDLQARNLAYGSRSFGTLAFGLDGSAAAHTAHLDFTTGELAMRLKSAGAFAHGAWSGQLRAFDVTGGDADALSLALDAPVDLALSAQHLHAQWFCLHGTPARICAGGDWNPLNWAATVNAKDLPLGTLTAGLSSDVGYRGSLTVNAHAVGSATTPTEGDLRADLTDARMLHRLANGRMQSILFGSGFVALSATHAAIDGKLQLDAGKIGSIHAHVGMTRSTPRWQDMPLTGDLHVETAELGFITLYAPEVDRIAGKLAASLTLGGNAGAPSLNGSLRLTDGELDQYQVNLLLRGATLEAQLAGTGLDFKGATRIGAGQAQAQGHLDWRESLPYGEFQLNGDNLRVADVPEAQIDASPQLKFKVAGRRIEVTGGVTVPRAKIAPKDLRNAVRTSSDEIIVGAQAQAPGPQFEVLTDITLTLGDHVSVDTSGLTGLLKGSITLHSGGDGATTGTGELSVGEGKFAAYAHKLDIERGRLIFSGGPIDNPGVDIRAVKKLPDVTAGVNVRGTLLAPTMTLFSDPTLSQSQILSLILGGGSLQSVQNKQTGGEVLAQGGAILAQQIGSRVGIQDVSVESDLNNETAVVLGRYLSPRIYISYGISLTESINTVKLQYTLNDHWTVKSEFGQARGADLVYTIEK